MHQYSAYSDCNTFNKNNQQTIKHNLRFRDIWESDEGYRQEETINSKGAEENLTSIGQLKE